MRPKDGLAILAALALLNAAGCAPKAPPYGSERSIFLPGDVRQSWAVAPVVNISGEGGVDPLLQADLVYQQLQQVQGLTVIPVNRVAEVFASLRMNSVQSEDQAAVVCDLLGCDALVVATVTTFDPYNPPKFGASVQLFAKPGNFARPASVDPRELSRSATPGNIESLPSQPKFLQAAGMFDAANGSVRESLAAYVAGRHEPLGPLGAKEYYVHMDRYAGFAYHTLIEDLLRKVEKAR